MSHIVLILTEVLSFKVYFENKTAECLEYSPNGFCRIGSLSERLGLMNLAGRKNESELVSRRLWTDTLLPLSGSYSIVGRSLVIYDDNGPKARGERLACSKYVDDSYTYFSYDSKLICCYKITFCVNDYVKNW